jgi:CHAT domain-containing protein
MIVVPGGLLGLLPLHAAWTPDDSRPTKRRYALDTVAISYAPSARSLGVARERVTRGASAVTAGKALIVANPSPVTAGPLRFAEDEADIVKWHFEVAETLPGKKAGLGQVSSSLPSAYLVHFTCHGFADLHTPLNSGVLLSGDEILNVRKIRDLRVGARLVVLSACETGVEGTALPDEVVAMPTGLLQAGVAGIIASLWSVADRATAMLMAEFYRRLCREKQPPTAALCAAQQWMRDKTNAEKSEAWKAGAGDWLPAKVAERFRSSLGETSEQTHSAPLWWAAFSHVGV